MTCEVGKRGREKGGEGRKENKEKEERKGGVGIIEGGKREGGRKERRKRERIRREGGRDKGKGE